MLFIYFKYQTQSSQSKLFMLKQTLPGEWKREGTGVVSIAFYFLFLSCDHFGNPYFG